jgi:hypothetical protein
MVRQIRTFFAAIAVVGLLLAPASVLAGTRIDSFDAAGSPPVVDVMLMRPLGLAMLVVSAGLFLPAAAVTAVVRPSEMGVTYDWLLKRPAHFVFVDPLGSH